MNPLRFIAVALCLAGGGLFPTVLGGGNIVFRRGSRRGK